MPGDGEPITLASQKSTLQGNLSCETPRKEEKKRTDKENIEAAIRKQMPDGLGVGAERLSTATLEEAG